MKKDKIAIIGCGNLGQSILNGLLENTNYKPENITVTKRNTASLDKFRKHDIHITSDNKQALRVSEIIIIALKPHHILEFIEEYKSLFKPNKHSIISLATGISISQIEKVLGSNFTIFRAMPNTAADVNESLTCLCDNSDNSQLTKKVHELFSSIGSTISINENLMESATVLGACGIAYVLRFIRGMIQGGIEIGFDAQTATDIVTQTVKGASQLLIERKEHPEFEIDKVTTPRGCTIAGLNEMEHNGFSSSLIKGVVASFDKIKK